ncbi:copper resistance CopC family protein [Ornithinicoccus halotolerans]|uniref:copper resistance CopC family protein n=1 Tax=Ornithinicoccus halotolerans TaxID=1748220 RepID=UPI00129557C9|nr:copper resistance CopC family protein [Ornithinicoccus halotolerans]
MFTDRSRRAVTIGVVVLAVLGLIGMLMAPLASAHDRLTGSTPEDGEQVAAPEELVLEFSGELSELGTAIEVTGPEGPATDGDPAIEGATVRQPLAADLAPGDYEVAWRVTSGDGHPISGELSFEVTGAGSDDAGGEAEPTQDAARGDEAAETGPTDTGAAEAGAAGAEETTEGAATVTPDAEQATEADSPVAEAEGSGGFPWLWAVVGVLGGAAVVAAVAWARRRS